MICVCLTAIPTSYKPGFVRHISCFAQRSCPVSFTAAVISSVWCARLYLSSLYWGRQPDWSLSLTTPSQWNPAYPDNVCLLRGQDNSIKYMIDLTRKWAFLTTCRVSDVSIATASSPANVRSSTLHYLPFQQGFGWSLPSIFSFPLRLFQHRPFLPENLGTAAEHTLFLSSQAAWLPQLFIFPLEILYV